MSTTRTPVRSGLSIRARAIAAGGAVSVGIGRSPRARGPLPSTGSPRALTTRPFQPFPGCRHVPPIIDATMPMPTGTRSSKGLMVAADSSTRTTSPIVARPPTARLTRSPSLTTDERPTTR